MGKKHLFTMIGLLLILLMIIGCSEKESGVVGVAMYDDGEAPAIPQGVQVQSLYLYNNPTLSSGLNDKRYKVIVRWNKVTTNVSGGTKDNVIGYKIFRDSKSSPIGIVDKDTLIFEDNDTDIEEGRTYAYYVCAFDSLLRETYSDSERIKISPTMASGHIPDRPLNVSLIRESNDSLTLVWTKPENMSELAEANDPLDSYMIYRKVGETGAFEIVASINASMYFYNDPTVTEGTRYYYKVRAITQSGLLGLESETKSMVITFDFNDDGFAPGVPTWQGITIPTETDPNTRVLSWLAPSYDDNGTQGTESAGDVLGYKIYRSEERDRNYTLAAIVSSTTSWTDTNILDANGNVVEYWYRVAAYDYSGNTGDMTQPLKVGTSTISIPTGFEGEVDHNDEIYLSWDKVSGFGYKVYESKNGTVYRELVQLSESTLSQYVTNNKVTYNVRKILDDSYYYYKVSAVSTTTGYESNKTYFVKLSRFETGGSAVNTVEIQAENLLSSAQVRGINYAYQKSFTENWGVPVNTNNNYYYLSTQSKYVDSENKNCLYFNPVGANESGTSDDYWWHSDGNTVTYNNNASGIGTNTQYRYMEQFRLMYMPSASGKYNIKINVIYTSNSGYYLVVPRTASTVIAAYQTEDFYSSTDYADYMLFSNVNLTAYDPVYLVFCAYRYHSSLGSNHAIYVDSIEFERID